MTRLFTETKIAGSKLLGLMLLAGAGVGTAQAQTLNVAQGNVIYSIPAANAAEMAFGNGGTTVEILGRTFTLSEVCKMYVDDSTVADNTVIVTYSGDSATVTIAGNIAQYVSAEVTGANVSITQSEEVGDETCGEITYQLSGESSNGSLYMTGDYKASFELLGLNLTNPSGAPIDIQDGKRISFSVKNGTDNTLTDGANGKQKGCLVCKGHLELKGKGKLTVYGNTAHGIFAKEYIEMKNCTVNVLKALKDGVNCNQYFLMESGELNISGTEDDGLQVSYKDDTDREAEDTGSFTLKGGKINVSITATAAKAIKADGNITISDGTIVASTSGGGKWDSSASKTKASACLGADGNIEITGGTLNLTASGSGGKGINVDGTATISGGEIEISTTGGMYAYVNGREYDNYTGDTDRLDSDQKSSPKGIKVDGNVTINGGTINITTTGTGGEGIESKSELTINDGTIVATTYDDAINSSSHMYINGGDITVIAKTNDGLDSNGNLYINGGYIRAFGGSSPECGIDANSEGGYKVYFTGGTLLAVGGSNSTPSNSQSTQAYVTGSGTVKSNTTIELRSGDSVLATFTVPSNYNTTGNYANSQNAPWGPNGNSGGILITCPGITKGGSYTLVNGSSSSNVTGVQYGSGGGH